MVEVLKRSGSSHSNLHPYFSQKVGSSPPKKTKRNISWTSWWWSSSQGGCHHRHRGADPEAGFLRHDDEENDHEQREEGAPSPRHHWIIRPRVSPSPDPAPPPRVAVAGSAVPTRRLPRIRCPCALLSPDPATPATKLCATAVERRHCSPPHHHCPHRRTEER